MKRKTILCSLFALACLGASTASAQASPVKIAIIKADDIRGITTNWDRFFALSKSKGIKVSAGIICNSLVGLDEDYVAWLNAYTASGDVEFWNHGWDHLRWTNDQGVQISEFQGSGYDHQKEHFEDAQNIMKDALGVSPVAFGSPYNATDADTVRVMEENADMRLLFTYSSTGPAGKTLARMALRGESDGTAKPNFDKFKIEYLSKPDLTFTALQFHPNGFNDAAFDEYAKIIDFLIAEGWIFVLPREYTSDTPLLANPSVSTSHPTRSADLSASLVVATQADLRFVWDTVDQGTDLESWTHSALLSAQSSGTITTQATGLKEGVDYIFRCYATNSEGSTWTAAKTFSLWPVNYTLLEDFESRTLNAAIKGQGAWGGDTSSSDEFSVRIDPDDAGNQVLYFNQGVDKEVFLNPGDLRIDDGTISTVFLRIRGVLAGSGASPLWLRTTLSDVANPSAFSDGETDLAINDDGAGNLMLSGIADPLTVAKWYRLWLVVDNASDTFDTYLQAEGEEQVLGLVDRAFRNGTAANDLVSLMFKTSSNSGNGSNGDVWIDDIYVAHGVDGHGFVPLGPDRDMDNLPDQWEQDYFGSIGVSAGGPAEDWDNDQLSDFGEWLAGTNPTDASSYFWSSIDTLSATPDEITLTWPSLTERTYSIEASDNLLEGSWTPLVSDIPGESSSTSRTFTIEEPSMFFRVRIDP